MNCFLIKLLFTILLLFYQVTIGFSQTKIVWSKTFGGKKSDMLYWIEPSAKGGFIVAGETNSIGAGGSDASVISLNKRGKTIWSRAYGGVKDDHCESILPTEDGGFIFVGGTKSYGAGGGDVWIVRLNIKGDTVWTKTFGGAKDDWAEEIQKTPDGGYIIPGFTTSSRGDLDALLLKIDSNGGVQWSRQYGGNKYDGAKSVVVLNDGYLIAGVTESFTKGKADAWLIRTNLSGDTLWTRTYGGVQYDMPFSIIQTRDKNFAFTGRNTSYSGHKLADVWLQVIDDNGESLISRTYGYDGAEGATFIQQTHDNGYIMCGLTNSVGAGNFDAYIIKTNEKGDTLWTQCFGDTTKENAFCIKEVRKDEYIFVGYKGLLNNEDEGWIVRFKRRMKRR